MKARWSIFEVVVALLLLLPTPATATPILYTFSFDALPVHGMPADSFSFFVDDLLVTPGVSIAMPTGTELNGLYFSPLRVSSTGFWISPQWEAPGINSLLGFSFSTDSLTLPTSPGTYLSTGNASLIFPGGPCPGIRCVSTHYLNGTLTIADEGASTVPDPGSTLFLFGIGLVGLSAWRKRHG